jgi:hypothetical protein
MAINTLSNFGEIKALDAAAGLGAATATLYVALFTTTPTDGTGAGGVEVANAGAYVRKVVSFDPAATSTGVAPQPSPAGIGFTKNTAEVLFDVAAASWGTVVGVGIYDSATYGGGNLWWYGDLVASKTVGIDDQLRFAAGAIVLKMD